MRGERELREPHKWGSNQTHDLKAISKWHEKRQKMMRKLMEKQQQMDTKKTETARQIAELRARNLLLNAQARQAHLDERIRNDAILKDRMSQNRGIFANHNLDFATPSAKSHGHHPPANPNHIEMNDIITLLRSHGRPNKGPRPGVTSGNTNNEVHPWKRSHISGAKALPESVTDLTTEVAFSTTPVSNSETTVPTDTTTEALVLETTEGPTIAPYPDSPVIEQISKVSTDNLVPAGILSRPTDVILGNPKVNSISPSPLIVLGSKKQGTDVIPVYPTVLHKTGFQRNDVSTNGPGKPSNPSVNFIPLTLPTPTNEIPTANTLSVRELLTVLNVPANIDPNFTIEMILKNSKIREILTIALHNISQLLTRDNSNPKQSVKLHNLSNAHDQRSRDSTEIPRVMATELSPSASTNTPVITSTTISTVHPLIPWHPQDQINKRQQGQLSDLTNNNMTKVHGVPTPVPGESTGGNIVKDTNNRNVRTDSPWEIHDGISGGLAATPKNVQIINILSREGDSLIVDSITHEKSSSPPSVLDRPTFSTGVSTKDSNTTPLPQVLTTSPKPRRNTISIDIFAIAIRDMLRKAQARRT